MSPRHLLLALSIVFIWGVNFAIIKLGLRQMTPLAMVVARFALSVIPLIFFVQRPKAPIKLVLAYSFFIFALQFGLLFIGMNLGMSAGLSSLILQLQVFFTIGLAVPVLAERPTAWQALGAALAFSGIGVVAAHVGGGDASIEGLALLVAAAASWGAGNVISRVISLRYGSQEPLGLVCWGSLFAIPPLVAVAFAIEGHAFLDRLTACWSRRPAAEGGITVSVGLAQATPGVHIRAEDLIRSADQSMYRAKARARDSDVHGIDAGTIVG